MKRRLLFVIFFFLSFSIFAKSSTLDETIASMSRSIVDSLSESTIVAILDFDAESEKLGSYIKDKLTSDIMEIDKTGKLRIVSRDELDKLEKETDFQYSGYVDDDTAVSLCKKLGAQALVVGKIEELGDDFLITVKMPHVETAQYLFFKTYSVSNDKKLKILSKESVKSKKIDSSVSTPPEIMVRTVGRKALAFNFEANRYSISGIAPSGVVSFNFDCNKKLALGARVGFSYDISSKDVSLFTLESLLTGRIYPFRSEIGSINAWFLEIQFGLALANVDGKFNTHQLDNSSNIYEYINCISGEIGWRHYLGATGSGFVEPYIRAGKPFIVGAGIALGFSF